MINTTITRPSHLAAPPNSDIAVAGKPLIHTHTVQQTTKPQPSRDVIIIHGMHNTTFPLSYTHAHNIVCHRIFHTHTTHTQYTHTHTHTHTHKITTSRFCVCVYVCVYVIYRSSLVGN